LWSQRVGKTKTHDEYQIIGVDSAKDSIYARLRIAPSADGHPTPGCIHFPVDEMFDKSYFEQLCSERREVRRKNDGQYYSVYVLPSGKRNEALDTLVGCLAVRRSLPGRLEQRLEYSTQGRETVMTPTGLQRPPAPVAQVRPLLPASGRTPLRPGIEGLAGWGQKI